DLPLHTTAGQFRPQVPGCTLCLKPKPAGGPVSVSVVGFNRNQHARCLFLVLLWASKEERIQRVIHPEILLIAKNIE
ncbi:MAG TPA: hypothetical protein VKS21_06705, partial [Spirochaetota bacterium]|nr:hypothetical protein [Spirochaetota bacterium]